MSLDSRYQAIRQKVAAMTDFSEQSLAPSRQLFDFHPDPNGPEMSLRPIPKRFDVWTNLVGLSLPPELTQMFSQLWYQVISGLSPHHRFYTVQPHTYHWELFIVKRPNETVSLQQLQESSAIVQGLLADYLPFVLTYRGFLLTPDGTVLVKGYGEFDELRRQLKEVLPWASAQQSQLGHVSLGRILDPVGPDYFAELNQLVQTSWDHEYGTITVDTVKWVHESQWYMEDHEIVNTFESQR